MPYKKIEKRREAYKRWAEKNKEKRKVYRIILWKSKKANPLPQKCYIRGCENIGERHHPDYTKPEEIEWICRFHHKRLKHSTNCSICGEKALARGFCNKHYKEQRKIVDSEYSNRVKRIRKEYRKKYHK